MQWCMDHFQREEGRAGFGGTELQHGTESGVLAQCPIRRKDTVYYPNRINISVIVIIVIIFWYCY